MLKTISFAVLMLASKVFAAELCLNENTLEDKLGTLRDVASESLISSSMADKSKFCEDRADKNSIAALMRKKENLLTYENQSGLFGLETGVCWWHSRLQRRLSYLGNFRPDLPKPSDREVKRILAKIKRGKKVVTIPGFKNLQEFSNAHELQIKRTLNAWMFGDSFLRQKWVSGLKGKTNLTPEKMKPYLEKVYSQFQESEGPLVQVLQMPGVMAHAWIINDMKKLNDTEYSLEIIDSNNPNKVTKYIVSSDQTNFAPLRKFNGYADTGYLDYYGDFVGYTYFNRELKNIKKAVTKFCKNEAEDSEEETEENNEENI
jgi:hypothetical protein